MSQGYPHRIAGRLRGHVRANAVAYLALFVALGGTGAWAADEITSKDIAKNAVRSKHIKAEQVKSGDLASKAVTAEKLAAPVSGTTHTTTPGFGISPTTQRASISVDVGPGPRRVLLWGYLNASSGSIAGGGNCSVFGSLFIDGVQQDATNAAVTLPRLESGNARGQLVFSLMPELAAGTHTISVRTTETTGCGVSAANSSQAATLHAIALSE